MHILDILGMHDQIEENEWVTFRLLWSVSLYTNKYAKHKHKLEVYLHVEMYSLTFVFLLIIQIGWRFQVVLEKTFLASQ